MSAKGVFTRDDGSATDEAAVVAVREAIARALRYHKKACPNIADMALQEAATLLHNLNASDHFTRADYDWLVGELARTQEVLA